MFRVLIHIRNNAICRFLGSENRDTFFSNVQRSRIVYEILSTAIFGKKKKGEVGIDRLVDEGVFSSSFPLHDGPYECKNMKGSEVPLNPRQVLYEYWARWGKWYKYQPLDHIREYFGEKIAIYFAWLGFYTGWLLPAAMVGLLVFLYGVFTMNNNRLALEVCNSGGSYKMCPLCDEKIGCKYWDLSDVCDDAKIAYLFDHPGTVFYAVFVSFWAVTFLEYWKRKSASLAHHWDCMGFKDEEERPRPEFAARAPFFERNPVTGIPEPSFPKALRNKRVAAGIGIVFLMLLDFTITEKRYNSIGVWSITWESFLNKILTKYKILGLSVDMNFNCPSHINIVSRMFVLRRLAHFTNTSVLLTAYYLVTFPYAVAIWG
ncbi:hypothetical protein J6590_071048 [Homalodisca vitripennis]|nr:hypothetical protein J6590_071048 [Homalodisca vitripennis]